MEHFLDHIMHYSNIAHLVLFGLILLAGLNVPISIDIVVFTGGTLAGTVMPEKTLVLFLFLWAACQLAAFESYFLGLYFGPALYRIKLFDKIIHPERIAKLHTFYEKFGFLTFLVGRFIPGGVRNALFMTSGMGKMPFSTFFFRDAIGCFLSTSFLFYIGLSFGQHYEYVIRIISKYQKAGVIVVSSTVLLFLLIKLLKKRSAKTN